jgi:hypothetical protein
MDTLDATQPDYPERAIARIKNPDVDPALRLDEAILLLGWMLGGGRPPAGAGERTTYLDCAAVIRQIAGVDR